MTTERSLSKETFSNDKKGAPPQKKSRPKTFFPNSLTSALQSEFPPADPPVINTTIGVSHSVRNACFKQKTTTSVINDRLVGEANRDNKPVNFIDLFKKPCWAIGKIGLFDDLIRLLYQNSSIISFFMENGIGLDLSSLLSDAWWLYCIEGAIWLLFSALLLPKKHRKWFFKMCRHYWSQFKNSCHAAFAFISCFGISIDGIHSEYFFCMFGVGIAVIIVHNILIKPYQNQIAELKNREFSNRQEFSTTLNKVLQKEFQHYLVATLSGFITTFYRETCIIFTINLFYGFLHHGQTLINLSHPIWLALYLPIAALGGLLQCYLTNREIAVAKYMRDNPDCTREDALNKFKSVNRIEKFLYVVDRIKDTAKTLAFVLTLLTLTGLVPHIAAVVTIVVTVLLLKFAISRYYKSADDNQSSNIGKQEKFESVTINGESNDCSDNEIDTDISHSQNYSNSLT